MPNHVVLFQPEIPANTGNIARTCLATNTSLHLIHPLGFSTEDKMVKRAGLDYWYDVTINHYDSLEELYDKYPEGEFYYVENFGDASFVDMDYTNTSRDHLFVFGRESDGIPHELLQGLEERCVRIPMTDKVRSLNLANSVSVMLFHALHEQGFPGLIK